VVEKYVLGPIVKAYIFGSGRKLRIPRNLGPYSNDAEYITALAVSGNYVFLSHNDFDEDLAEDAQHIISLLNNLQPIPAALLPSQPRHFSLHITTCL